SRYCRAVRRSLTSTSVAKASTRAKVARTAVVGAMLVLPVACGTGDEAAFSGVVEEAPGSLDTTSTIAPNTQATEAPTTVVSTTSEAAASGVFPTGGELLVSFTYQPSSSGQAKRPYVAVWVEDTDGNLVDTISLWFKQGAKGTKWLSDLTQWYGTSGGDDTTMSGATRVAGDYTVSWDGTDADGNPIAAGEYVLNIESAREHGPTSFTSGTITISDDGFSASLEDDGELSGTSAVLTV
ncbi:MAG: DUF2271 domain-containing protein, partial [Actinomycetia bacterium]|nr:DUF2271 domain-containing protein [Actinomycetes bacterium]